MKRTRISEEFALAVHDYLLIAQTALAPADLCLIFGNKHIIEPLATRAAALYHAGYAPLILASGGVKTKNRTTEAQALRQSLLAKGVPAASILTENKSTHTGENVLLSRALLEREGHAPCITSVIGIGHIVAARRFLMTLERHWPEIHKMQVSVNPFSVPPEAWHTHPHFHARALQEWRKIAPYQAEDKIREIDVDRLNRITRAMASLRLSPRTPGVCPDESVKAAASAHNHPSARPVFT